jgi:signal transduction histidine kinase
MIEMRDTGIGIEPENLEKIFDAFEQVGTRREGLGLGLAISKAVVERLGGTIHAGSAGAGKGATFVIEFAVAAAA